MGSHSALLVVEYPFHLIDIALHSIHLQKQGWGVDSLKIHADCTFMHIHPLHELHRLYSHNSRQMESENALSTKAISTSQQQLCSSCSYFR
jgi:hypothetical protein